MFRPEAEASDSDDFRGFNEARRIMWCHEARAVVCQRVNMTDFMQDPSIIAVHVDNTTRADRVYLTAFDETGTLVRADILYTDEPGEHLDVTPEFDHDFTDMPVPEKSELAELIARETGWVIDMTELRRYDLVQDRRQTQRAAFLAHLGDMINTGQAKGFFFGNTDDSDEPDTA